MDFDTFQFPVPPTMPRAVSYLNDNQFTGELPDWLSNFTQLQVMCARAFSL